MANILVRKSLATFEREAAAGQGRKSGRRWGESGGAPLKRCLTALDLVALGIGAIIGAGIFVLTGHAAAANAGPAITLSFVLGAVVCAFAGLCYAEMAARGSPWAVARLPKTFLPPKPPAKPRSA